VAAVSTLVVLVRQGEDRGVERTAVEAEELARTAVSVSNSASLTHWD
jgi:hypothetical protein